MNIITYSISKSIFEAIRNDKWEKKDIKHCFDRFNGTHARLAIDWYGGQSKVIEQFSPTLFPPKSQIGKCMGMIGKELKESCRKPKTKMKRNVTNIEMESPNYGFRDICARTDNKILIVSDRNATFKLYMQHYDYFQNLVLQSYEKNIQLGSKSPKFFSACCLICSESAQCNCLPMFRKMSLWADIA